MYKERQMYFSMEGEVESDWEIQKSSFLVWTILFYFYCFLWGAILLLTKKDSRYSTGTGSEKSTPLCNCGIHKASFLRLERFSCYADSRDSNENSR